MRAKVGEREWMLRVYTHLGPYRTWRTATDDIFNYIIVIENIWMYIIGMPLFKCVCFCRFGNKSGPASYSQASRCHGIETLSALLFLCEENPPVVGRFPLKLDSSAELWCFLCFCYPEQVIEEKTTLVKYESDNTQLNTAFMPKTGEITELWKMA